MSKGEEFLEKLHRRWANFIKADYEFQALFSINPKINDLHQIDLDELVELDKQRSEALQKLVKTVEKFLKSES